MNDVSELFLFSHNASVAKMATNYVHDDSGATFIPATQRPDGTWRKARRVKDGYVPQEEMPLYESKGKQWAKNKPTHPPGLHPDDVAKLESMRGQGCLPSPSSMSSHVNSSHTGSGSILTPSNPLQGLSKSAKKNAKRKEKKKEKQNQLKSNISDTSIVENMKEIHISINNDSKTETQFTNNMHSAETMKRLKNLRKKLREIEVLKEKIVSGELPKPDNDQIEKLNRQKQIEREIEDLELSMEDDS